MRYKKHKKKKNFKYILTHYRYKLSPGDIVAGLIKYKEYQSFLIDIGDNIAGYLPIEEIQLTIFNYSIINIVKDYLYITREFFLITYNTNKYKRSVLSIKRLEYIRAWKRIQQISIEDIVFKLPVERINKGGIITYLEGIQAFIPNSHQYLLKNSRFRVNTKYNVKCKLLLIQQNKNEVILSQKSALLHLSKHKFRLGELIYGIIVNIQKYGIFIDLYGILGLLHISEIKLSYINNLNKSFYIGQMIKIKIIHINLKQGRLSVSTKNL